MGGVYTNGKKNRKVWEAQALAELDQDPPVFETWYTVLPETENVRLIYIAVRRLDDDANAKNVQLAVVIDGVTSYGSVAQNDNTWYYWYLSPHTAEDYDALTNIFNASYYEDLRGHEVKVEVRQFVVAIGANAELDGRIEYEVLKNAA